MKPTAPAPLTPADPVTPATPQATMGSVRKTLSPHLTRHLTRTPIVIAVSRF